MNPASSYSNILAWLDASHDVGTWMCALLFAPPGTAIGKSITSRMNDWHHRSGDNFDFFCVGYIDWDEYSEEQVVALTTDRATGHVEKYYYSAKAFDDIRRHVEANSDWSYSSEADLILVNAVQGHQSLDDQFSNYIRSRLALNRIIALDMDLMIQDKVLGSASRLMERVCQASDAAVARGETPSVIRFSDEMFTRGLLEGGLLRFIKALKLDKPLASRHFIVGGHLLDKGRLQPQ